MLESKFSTNISLCTLDSAAISFCFSSKYFLYLFIFSFFFFLCCLLLNIFVKVGHKIVVASIATAIASEDQDSLIVVSPALILWRVLIKLTEEVIPIVSIGPKVYIKGTSSGSLTDGGPSIFIVLFWIILLILGDLKK